jgi:hypothetical protein
MPPNEQGNGGPGESTTTLAMSEQSKQPSLSEISHLFLTGLRQRQTHGAHPPTRKAPPAVSIDLTPEEFAGPTSPQESEGLIAPAADVPQPRLSVVLAHHLGDNALKNVHQYAAFVAETCQRVGLIELGDDGLRLTCFDATAMGQLESDAPPAATIEPVDGKRIRQAIEEMSWDVQRWLLYLPGGPRTTAACDLLKRIERWTLLVAADDEGVIAAYRLLKGLTALIPPPRRQGTALGLAVLEADDQGQATVVFRKLAGASERFLNQAVESEGRVAPAPKAAEQVVLWHRAAHSSQEHWSAVAELAARSTAPAAAPAQVNPAPAPSPAPASEARQEPPSHQPSNLSINSAMNISTDCQPQASDAAPQKKSLAQVLDLAPDADAAAILAAIVQQQTQWIITPLKPPACAAAMVAVDRQGRLTLLGVVAGGLDDLQVIGQGYRWLMENRPLVRMALPQMNIDSAALPRLVLFLDQADTRGDQLSAILHGGAAAVQTYRRLRWGEKTGLLLEAA